MNAAASSSGAATSTLGLFAREFTPRKRRRSPELEPSKEVSRLVDVTREDFREDLEAGAQTLRKELKIRLAGHREQLEMALRTEIVSKRECLEMTLRADFAVGTERLKTALAVELAAEAE